MILVVAVQRQCAAQSSPFRYDDDLSTFISGGRASSGWDTLKYVPLSASDPTIFLSFGLDDRERVEGVSNALLGFRNKGDNAYDLHRLLVYADVQINAVRAFIQLGSETEGGRAHGPLPTDIDRLDLAQGFVDATLPLDIGKVTVRTGRFEMAYDEGALIGLRDGPNVRQVWDGIQAFQTADAERVDAFLVRPVDVSPGYFDDRDMSGQLLWGVHAQLAPRAFLPVRATAFYYGNTMPKVLFSPKPGKEETHTFGLRLLSQIAAFDGSVGGIGQAGTYDRSKVAAWAAHADIGWTAQGAWKLRLGLRGDVLSGGGEAGGTQHTFNALYPNYAYSTEATIEAPANLVQLGSTFTVHPNRSVSVTYTLEGLWRYSLVDAFYAAPTIPLVPPKGSRQRFDGVEQQIEVTWNINRRFSLTCAYVNFDPAGFLSHARALSQNYGMTELSFRY